MSRIDEWSGVEAGLRDEPPEALTPIRGAARPPIYVYFIEGYKGPVKSTMLRPGIVFDTTPDNRLIGIEILDYARLTVDGDGSE